MIVIPSDIREGDFIYLSFSPFKIQQNGKGSKSSVPECEYKVEKFDGKYLSVVSTSGQYSLIFTKDMLDNWYGTCRKAKS